MTTDSQLTHVDPQGRPRMVDIGGKVVTRRVAIAEARVVFPAEVAMALRRDDMRSTKGPVVDTAIIAGTMAVKRTHELIPFCHALPIDRCRITVDFVTATEMSVCCEVSAVYRTGVEMEAMTGASVAALTIYDMCKALSHEIVIAGLHLVEKSGGRRDVRGGEVRE
jgi:cyclic pyranopterin phosphate synthase